MINLFDLKPGDRLSLISGQQVEVIDNMEDGMWVQVRDLAEGPDAASELCHAQDIARVISSGQAD